MSFYGHTIRQLEVPFCLVLRGLMTRINTFNLSEECLLTVGEFNCTVRNPPSGPSPWAGALAAGFRNAMPLYSVTAKSLEV